MLLFGCLVESAGGASPLIKHNNFTLFVAEKGEMAIIVDSLDKLDDDNALVSDITTDVPVSGVERDLLTRRFYRVWHRKAIKTKRHFDAFFWIVIIGGYRIMHDPLHIEIQGGRIVTCALCFVFANKGVGVLLFFEVADKTDVLRHSWPVAGLLSIRQAADATDTSCQYLALNVSKRALSNGDRVRMVCIKVDDFHLWVHRVCSFLLSCLDMQTRSVKQKKGTIGRKTATATSCQRAKANNRRYSTAQWSSFATCLL